MEILETIPQYTNPNWVGIVLLCGLGLALITIAFKDTNYFAPIASLLSFITIMVGLVGFALTRNEVYTHDEYIVRITDMSAQEFNEKYTIVKRFDYSDAIQIKERDK